MLPYRRSEHSMQASPRSLTTNQQSNHTVANTVPSQLTRCGATVFVYHTRKIFMTYHNDNLATPPIQLLIPLCQTVDDAGSNLTWLHGYCLVTLRHVGGGLHLSGRIALGQRYGENLDLIRDLAASLHTGAVLSGYDLTDIIGKLGQLPIEANDPKPALNLLAMLKCMLGFHAPIDLASDDHSQTAVVVQHLRLPQGMDQATKDVMDDEWFEGGFSEAASVTPYRVASDLVESSRACIGAFAEIYLAKKEKPLLLAAWAQWERSIQPQLAALAFVPEIGGEPIRIN